MSEINPTVEERFWDKVNRAGSVPSHCPELGPCWEWTGATTKVSRQGYGSFRVGQGRNVLAHRWTFAQTATIPPGLLVLHRCDNALCVNTQHLFLGTQKENVLDAVAKGRHAHMPERLVSYEGVERSIGAWARAKGLKPSTVVHRLGAGWSVERALTTPLGARPSGVKSGKAAA